MAGINKAIVVGRVGRDPEIRSFDSGDKIANFSIATSEVWRDKGSGERREKTQWHNIAVRAQGLVKIVEQYVRKGSLIGVLGTLETREWEKDGIKRYSTEIVLSPYSGELQLLGSKSDGESDSSNNGNSRYSNSDSGYSSGGTGGGYNRDMEDEIPFAPEWR